MTEKWDPEEFKRKVKEYTESVKQPAKARAAKLQAKANGGAEVRKRAAQPLPLTFFDECDATVLKRWLMKGVIAYGETSSWIAPPGKGKSAIHSDICVHLAGNKSWRGYRTKGPIGCVYFAFERADLVKRRNLAYTRRYGFKGLPIAITARILDLMRPDCVDIILATVEAAEARFGIPVGYIVIDTFGKGIAAGGGDEDKARDQNKCLTNLRRLHERHDLHIAIVGHTGKDETRGSRGSNAHPADADLQVQIFGEGDMKIARVIKGNDQPEGDLTTFRLISADLGPDEDGDPVTTAIVSDEMPDKHMRQAAGKMTKLPKSARIAMRALAEALTECPETPPASDHIPRGAQTTTIEHWRKYAFKRGISTSSESRARQQAFKRASMDLISDEIVGAWGDYVWQTNKEGNGHANTRTSL
jgi:AAA domain